jgi:hypothetical protein
MLLVTPAATSSHRAGRQLPNAPNLLFIILRDNLLTTAKKPLAVAQLVRVRFDSDFFAVYKLNTEPGHNLVCGADV